MKYEQSRSGLFIPEGLGGIDPSRIIQPDQKGVVYASGFGGAKLPLKPGDLPPMMGGDFAAVVAPYQVSTAVGSAINTTTTETDLFDSDPIFAINYFQPGRTIRINLMGSYQTTGTPTLTFKLRGSVGGITGTLFETSGILTTATGVASAQLFWAEIYLQCWTTGAAGTGIAWGIIEAYSASGVTLASVAMPATSATTAFALNTTIANSISFTQTWSANSASNTMTRGGYAVEALN